MTSWSKTPVDGHLGPFLWSGAAAGDGRDARDWLTEHRPSALSELIGAARDSNNVEQTLLDSKPSIFWLNSKVPTSMHCNKFYRLQHWRDARSIFARRWCVVFSVTDLELHTKRQCWDLETMVSRPECTRVHFVQVSVRRPDGQGLGLGLKTARLVPTPVARLP